MGLRLGTREFESDGFQVETIGDANAFVEMCGTFAFKYWVDLITRDMDISINKMNGISTKKLSVEELGREYLVISAKRDSYQGLLNFMNEQLEAAKKILKEEDERGTDG